MLDPEQIIARLHVLGDGEVELVAVLHHPLMAPHAILVTFVVDLSPSHGGGEFLAGVDNARAGVTFLETVGPLGSDFANGQRKTNVNKQNWYQRPAFRSFCDTKPK